jgi:hypothetical protein
VKPSIRFPPPLASGRGHGRLGVDTKRGRLTVVALRGLPGVATVRAGWLRPWLAAAPVMTVALLLAVPAEASRSMHPTLNSPRPALTGKVNLPLAALTGRGLKRPPARVVPARVRSGPPVAKAAFHNTYFNPGYSDCPTVFPSGATLSQIFVTGPLVYEARDDAWFYFYNGITTSGSGWQVIAWEGPYWVNGPWWDRVWSPQLGWLWVTDGGGGSLFTIYRDDALGAHWVVDYRTGQSFTSYTYAVRDAGRGYCDDYSGGFSSRAPVSAKAADTSVPARAAHSLSRRRAEGYLERYVVRGQRLLENAEDPIVPGATTTVTWRFSGCGPSRKGRAHRHAAPCGYDLAVVVVPNEGSNEQFRALRCGDSRVFVKFRSKRSRRLKIVSDNFRCRRDPRSAEAPPGAPQQPLGNPPPPPTTGPPPPPAASE